MKKDVDEAQKDEDGDTEKADKKKKRQRKPKKDKEEGDQAAEGGSSKMEYRPKTAPTDASKKGETKVENTDIKKQDTKPALVEEKKPSNADEKSLEAKK